MSSIYNHQQDFSTAQEFVDFFLNHHFFKVGEIWDVNTTGRGGHIYRGHSDAEWKLEPIVFRDPNILKTFTPQVPGELDEDHADIWLGMHLHAELRASHIFLENADKLGIPTPLDYTLLEEHKAMIGDVLNQREVDLAEYFPSKSLHGGIALSQHHGIPTRLLDWTESPLVACYFAAYKASSLVPEGQRVNSDFISVTCFLSDRFRKSNKVVKVKSPRSANTFLKHQKGLFTLTPYANEYLSRHKRWPALEDIIEEEEELRGCLKKYRLPTSEADELLRILYNHDISTVHLMPTLDNAAKAFSEASILFPSPF